MMDSDSPLSAADSAAALDDAQLEHALRNAVVQTFERGDFENLTLKRMRAAATQELGLEEGFFRTHAKWKDRSKEIVNGEVERLEKTLNSPPKSDAAAESAYASPAKAPAKRKAPAKSKAPAKRKAPSDASGSKRKSTDAVPSQKAKRRKKSPTPNESDELSDPPSDFDKSSENKAKSDEDADTSPVKKGSTKLKTALKPVPKEDDELGGDSELSDVLDEPPTKLRGGKRSPSKASKLSKTKTKSDTAKSSKKEKAKSKAKANTDLTPQEEEIRRLQGQLVKCGVRKLWGKELMRFDTPGEKIAHLKGMLRDVGMEGRFSEDKARQIKEERELRADLEGIQEGDKLWGTKEDEPRRRLAKGLQELQGLGDDEESD